MTLEEARQMVDFAIAERIRFGKHFTVSDLPPQFLDAVVEVMKAPAPGLLEAEAKIKEQHEQIVLLNRQLGAAKARETKLRKGETLEAEAGN